MEDRGDSSWLDTFLTDHDLGQWWSSAFDEAERALIRRRVDTSVRKNPTSGRLRHEQRQEGPSRFLSSLSGVMNRKNSRGIALRLAEKSAELADTEGLIISRHFAYLQLAMICRDMIVERPELKARAIEACRRQVELAPSMARIFGYPAEQLPAHLGYQILVRLLEDEGRFSEALDVAREAMHYGWYGNWLRVVGRLRSRTASEPR